MKARLLLARNIHAILTARKESQTALALWCHKKVSWINKILAGRRPMHIDDFDRVADFLGISVYQLFQPGVSALTERRRPGDRRKKQDRRIGHAERTVISEGFPTKGQGHEATDDAAAATQAELAALVADFSARANHLLAQSDPRGQTPPTRARVPKASAHRRRAGRSDAVEYQSGDTEKHK